MSISLFKSDQSKLDKLTSMPRFTPGNIKIYDWDLDYVDAPALASCIDVLVKKKWNDFVPDNNTPVILDCGANIGISVLNYKRQFPSAKIIAFEPDPLIAKVLKRNLLKNGAQDVTILEAAVWIHDGEMSFYCEGADGSRVVVEGDCIEKNSVVKTIDLSRFLSEPIDLIKMDIEGAEFEVIAHLNNKLSSVKNIIMECHIDNTKMDKFAKLLQVLSCAEFKVSINSYGAWRDLVHNPAKLSEEFDQYILLAAWR